MDLSEIRAYVREFLDLTSSDLSDGLINRWIAEGGHQVLKSRSHWVHLETRLPVTTGIGTQEYDIATSLRTILAADCTVSGPLALMDEAMAVATYYRGTATIRTGRPESITRYEKGKIKVWPVPDQAYVINLLGQRPYVEPAPTGALDLPVDLSDCVLDWVMSRAYMHQDDVPTANAYRQLFETGLARYVDDEDNTSDAAPLIFGGGAWQSRGTPPLLGDPRGPGIGQFGPF